MFAMLNNNSLNDKLLDGKDANTVIQRRLDDQGVRVWRYRGGKLFGACQRSVNRSVVNGLVQGIKDSDRSYTQAGGKDKGKDAHNADF